MNIKHLDRANLSTDGLINSEQKQNEPTARAVLAEFFQLLEDYAPAWYTEEHHDRAVAALRGTD